MSSLRTAIALLATAVAVLAVPVAVEAQYVVPPGNSAVNQYTEAVPTAGGGQDTGGGGKRSAHHAPAKVLGARNAHRLDAQGPQGRAAAEVATATAPSEGVRVGSAANGAPVETTDQGGGTGGGAGTGKPLGGASQDGGPGGRATPAPAGSSGLGEVLAQATGSSSSGQMGALLPLVILAAIAWSLAFFMRQRRRVD
jgi:hypothetical protein